MENLELINAEHLQVLSELVADHPDGVRLLPFETSVYLVLLLVDLEHEFLIVQEFLLFNIECLVEFLHHKRLATARVSPDVNTLEFLE